MDRSSVSRHFKFPSSRKQARISLREWVDRPGRSVNSLECLRIFRQVVAAVENMHNKGTAVNNIRPSCLAVSSLDCVSFIEASSSCYDFEFSWYRSPGEQGQGQSAFAADVYKLGVLLFELFCGFESEKQKHGLMLQLRDRVLPPQLLLRWPKIASLCLWLMHPQTSKRPELSHILQSGILDEGRDDLEEHEVVMKLREEIEVHDSLLEFLLKMKRTKQASANKLHGVICFLSNDIEEVVSQRSFLMKKSSFHEEENCDCSTGCKEKNPSPSYKANDDSTSSESKKRFRLLHKEKTLSKSSRIMDNFKKLEAAYFSLRCKPSNLASKHGSKKLKVDDINSKESNDRTEQSSVDDMVSKQSEHGYGMGEWINPFLEGLCKYLTFNKFKVCAELKQGDLLNSPNLICSLAFDRDKHFFATTGVNKKIKVFEYDAILNDDRDIHYPMVEMVGRSRFSNVCWSSYIKSQIASSDFEGLVQVWDVSRSQVLVDMREHEKRVWSIDFSLTYPTVLASGSDDYTTKLWNINQGGSVSTIRTKANVCSVKFSPSGNLIAIGSADHNVYCYDLRNIRLPLCTIVGHAKTVSYVKFLDSSTIVSSSTDSTLKLWDLSMNTSRVIDSPAQTFSGHTNVKNFVGLSISDGYIATGSETNEIFVYQKVFSMPVLSYNFGCIDPISGLEDEGVSQFISCVCWRGDSPTLLAANSSGNIKILEMI